MSDGQIYKVLSPSTRKGNLRWTESLLTYRNPPTIRFLGALWSSHSHFYFPLSPQTYDVLANQQSGVSVNPDWASLYTDPSVDKPTRPHMRTRTSSNSSKDSSRPLTPVGQSYPQHNGSAKTVNSKSPASSSMTASTLPASSRYQSTAASEASSVRRVSAAAASPLSKATSFPATTASPNGAPSSIQSPQPNSNGDVSAFGDELAQNFLHPKYQEQRRGSITSVKSEMSTKSLSGKLSFSKRLRRVLSMNNMKDNDDTGSIREPSDESIHSTVSESSANPSLRFIRNRSNRFSQLNRSSVHSSTSPVLSNQQYDDDTTLESYITSVSSGGSVRASMHPPRPGTPQPMISRRRSLGGLGSLFSRNQANLEEESVVSDTPSLAPKIVSQSTNDRSFASMVKRRHSSGDLKFLASERETERDSINQVESDKIIISKDDSSAGRGNLGTAVKDRPSMLRHDSLEGRDRVKGILKGKLLALMNTKICQIVYKCVRLIPHTYLAYVFIIIIIIIINSSKVFSDDVYRFPSCANRFWKFSAGRPQRPQPFSSHLKLRANAAEGFASTIKRLQATTAITISLFYKCARRTTSSRGFCWASRATNWVAALPGWPWFRLFVSFVNV